MCDLITLAVSVTVTTEDPVRRADGPVPVVSGSDVVDETIMCLMARLEGQQATTAANGGRVDETVKWHPISFRWTGPGRPGGNLPCGLLHLALNTDMQPWAATAMTDKANGKQRLGKPTL
jgi:hypothetical protein